MIKYLALLTVLLLAESKNMIEKELSNESKSIRIRAEAVLKDLVDALKLYQNDLDLNHQINMKQVEQEIGKMNKQNSQLECPLDKSIENGNSHHCAQEEVRKQKDNAHTIKLKDHKLQMRRAVDEDVSRMEDVQSDEDEEMKSALAMAQVEAKKEEDKQVVEFLKALLNKPMSAMEFAYISIIANSVIRNEEINIEALNIIADHKKVF